MDLLPNDDDKQYVQKKPFNLIECNDHVHIMCSALGRKNTA